MKVIFLDIDGVLNGYNYLTHFIYKLGSISHNKKIIKWCRNISDINGIHERKVKRLAKIVHSTNAKIVLSSSTRFLWEYDIDKLVESNNMYKIKCLFDKYNIEVIGITPKLDYTTRRDMEIFSWLFNCKDEVESFIILDDENTILYLFAYDYNFIQTSSAYNGEMITGSPHENTGLKNKHVRRAIKILNKRGK